MLAAAILRLNSVGVPSCTINPAARAYRRLSPPSTGSSSSTSTLDLLQRDGAQPLVSRIDAHIWRIRPPSSTLTLHAHRCGSVGVTNPHYKSSRVYAPDGCLRLQQARAARLRLSTLFNLMALNRFSTESTVWGYRTCTINPAAPGVTDDCHRLRQARTARLRPATTFILTALNRSSIDSGSPSIARREDRATWPVFFAGNGSGASCWFGSVRLSDTRRRARRRRD